MPGVKDCIKGTFTHAGHAAQRRDRNIYTCESIVNGGRRMSEYHDEVDNLIDDALYYVSQFDWITPTMAFAEDFIHGQLFGGGDFQIVISPGYCLNDIKALVKKAKIESWGWIQRKGFRAMFTVKVEDVKRTYQVLSKNGIQMEFVPEGANQQK